MSFVMYVMKGGNQKVVLPVENRNNKKIALKMH